MLFLRFNEIILRTFGPSVSVLALFFPGQLTYVNFFHSAITGYLTDFHYSLKIFNFT
ncbi:hypothetical protein EFW57_03646 [Bacillus velezensis]|nr:hypothetical protein EFW57_03646 [Bacillus velezensis]